MHPHRGGLPQRPGEKVVIAPGQALLIERMAPFVGSGQEGRERLAWHHPGGDAEVLGTQGAGEGVGGAGALATLRVVAPAVEEFGAELLLQSLGQIGGGLGVGHGSHLLQQHR